MKPLFNLFSCTKVSGMLCVMILISNLSNQAISQVCIEASFLDEAAGKAYFFHNGLYVRSTFLGINETGTIDPDYPKTILNNFSTNWPANWSNIDAAFADISAGKIYFFRGNQYIRYSYAGVGVTGQVDPGYPKQILGNFSSNWPAGWGSVDAAFLDADDGKVYFFRGDQYARFSYDGVGVTGQIDPGYPRSIQGNFASNWISSWGEVSSVLYAENASKAYFFSGEEYARYHSEGVGVTGSIDNGYPRIINGNFINSLPHEWNCGTTSIADYLNADIRVYPNPSKSNIVVEFFTQRPEEIEVALLNKMGQVQMQENVDAISGENQLAFDLSGLPNGLYFLRLGNKFTKTIIKN